MKYLILILSSVFILSCSSNADSPTNFNPTPISYIIKFSGELSGYNYFPNSPDTEFLKISTTTAYNNYVTTLETNPISPTFNENYSFTPLPDFLVKDILVINYKCVGDLGQKIIINSIIENEEEIVVNFTKIQYVSGPQASGKPFILVEVPKSEKPVVFIEQ